MNNGALIENWAWMAGAVAVNVLWQGTILGGLGGLALLLMRKASAQARYVAACTTLVAMAALVPVNLIWIGEPPVAATIPEPFVSVTGQLQETSPGAVLVPVPVPVPQTGAYAPPSAKEPLTPHTTEIPASTPELRPKFGAIAWYNRAMPWVGLFWWVGLLVATAYNFLGLLSVRSLRRRAMPAAQKIEALAERIAHRIGVRTPVTVALVDGLPSALAIGFYRSMVLLPSSTVTGMSPEALEAVLAHEFAHIQRWDRWMNLFQRLTEALLFYHPFVWWISYHITNERELCCDAVAIEVCGDRVLYVQALLEMAEQGSSSPALALSSHGGNFSRRVRAILGSNASFDAKAQGRLTTSIGTAAAALLPIVFWLLANTGNAESVPERILHFPAGHSVGTLYGRWADRDYRKVPWMPDHNEGWTVLGAAQGDVSIPENTVVKLTIGTTDLGFLRYLKPNDIYFLDCRYKPLNDKDISPIESLTELRALDMSDIGTLTGAAFSSLKGIKNLEWLDYSRTPIEELPVGSLTNFPRLKYFSAHVGEYADEVLTEIGELPDIEYLCAKAGSVSVAGMRHLSGTKSMRGLVLDNVNLTDDSFSELTSLPNLRYLDLKKNPIAYGAAGHLNVFPSLIHIDLENTLITDDSVALLAGNPTLERVFLSNTKVTEACLDTLSSLPALQTVKLVETGVSEEAAGAFALGLGLRPDNTSKPQKSSNSDAPKVGLVMSHFTATGPHAISRPYGYSNQESDDTAKALNEANFDLYAVLEPGTAGLGELPALLHKHGLSEKVVDGTDPKALAQLDVIYISTLPNAQIPMLNALDTAIKSGTGLVNISVVGGLTPGDLDPMIERITGIERPIYTWEGFQDSACPILVSHPILGNYKPGTTFILNTLNGFRSDTGILHDATVLLGTPSSYPGTFPVLYVREHGKGREVRAQWHRAPQPGIPFPGFSFYVRCINWAAHRDADTIW